MNRKNIFSWLTVTGKRVILCLHKTKLWGLDFFSVLGCTESSRCPKHPPRRGSKRPELLPHFLSSSLKPCKDIILTRDCTEHVPIYLIYLSIAFTLAEYQAVAPPPAILSVSISSIQGAAKMMDLLENIYIPIYMKKIHINSHFCVNVVFLLKIHSKKQGKYKPFFEPPPTN